MSTSIVTQIAPMYPYDADPESEGVFAVINVAEDVAPIQLQQALKLVSLKENWDDGDNCVDMVTFRANLSSALRDADLSLRGVQIIRFGFLGE